MNRYTTVLFLVMVNTVSAGRLDDCNVVSIHTDPNRDKFKECAAKNKTIVESPKAQKFANCNALSLSINPSREKFKECARSRQTLAGSLKPKEFVDCGYIPKPTEQNRNPKWKKFKKCAYLTNSDLEVTKEHLANINYDEFDLALIYVAGHNFFVKSNGKYLAVYPHDNGAATFDEGLTLSRLGKNLAFYNTNLDPVLELEYDFAMPFKDGRSLVCKGCSVWQDPNFGYPGGGEWGYINRRGEEVVPVKYTSSEILLK